MREDRVMDEQREESQAGSGPRRRGVMVVALGAVLLGAAGLAVALSGVAAATPAAAPSSGSCAPSAPHLTVEGTGQGSGTPDVLRAVFGFSTTASSSAAR